MDKWTDFFQNYVNDFVKTGYEKELIKIENNEYNSRRLTKGYERQYIFFSGKFQKNGEEYESCYDRLVAEKVDRMF